MRILDLFCGAGGLASGFKKMGFKITGVDKSPSAGGTYEANEYGEFVECNLAKHTVHGNFDIVCGGPPCKPWSSVNTIKRGELHEDFELLARFFRHVEANRPRAFLMENVPPLMKTEIFSTLVKRLSSKFKYSIQKAVISYGDFGAPIRRHRLIVFGIRDGIADSFFHDLSEHQRPAATVKDAIWHLRERSRNEVRDHTWPELKTIKKYLAYYESGKYGWYVLDWNRPAPSFGNITKTYILHPDSFNGGLTRVISVKEASLIMGFPSEFRFVEGLGLGERYQLIADSVSPVFSFAAAQVIGRLMSD
jgi:DNA (cytosine-5)-methyltransferase 1